MKQLLDRRRRFVFRGNASALSGRIVRPDDVPFDSHVASSLTVAGGKSIARGADIRFGRYGSVQRAETSAEGVFDTREQHVELTNHRDKSYALTTQTHVAADVTGLTVGEKPKLFVRHVRATLNARSATGSGEPPIGPGPDTIVEGMAIDGHELTVELNLALFQRCDTRAKLLMAADDPDAVKTSGHCLFMPSVLHSEPVPPTGRLLQSQGTIYTTVVKSITWTREQHPTATIDHHVVIVPNFGRIYVGELLITDLSRRMTMLRLELGSDAGGDVACAEVESNGIWS